MTPRQIDRTGSPPATDHATEATEARAILRQTAVSEGYCYVLGAGDGRLLEGLVRHSALRVIAVDHDAQRVDALRRRLEATSLYGIRAAVHVGDPASFDFPPYLASLIVCEDLAAAGFSSAEACVKTLFDALRPYGGMLCLRISGEGDERLAGTIGHAELPDAVVKRAGSFTWITRTGPLSGAADWTHEAADAGNTWLSHDRRVKVPLGVLWFGGPAGHPDLFMNRHGDPPTARVCEGRMFIHGNGLLTAVDVYTGRRLWQRSLPEVKAFRNLRSNVRPGNRFLQSGEKNARAQFVAHRDGLYLAYGQRLLVWDPATGKTRAEFDVNAADNNESRHGTEPLYLGDVKIAGDVIVVGAEFPANDVESVFVTADFRDLSKEQLAETIRVLETWRPGSELGRMPGEGEADYIVRLFNHLLRHERLAETVPDPRKSKAWKNEKIRDHVQSALQAIERYRETTKRTFAPYLTIEHHNRRLLEACFPAVRKLPAKYYWNNLYPWDGAYTRQIIGLDRQTGRVLWRQRARHVFPQKSIAVGRNKVFCLDRGDLDTEAFLARRGIKRTTDGTLLALDATTGRVLWRRSDNILGYQTFYSAEQDILVQATVFDPEPEQWWNKARDVRLRFIAYRGEDGQLLWDNSLALHRPGGGHRLWCSWLLHDDTIIAESYHDAYAEFYGFNLFTGELKKRRSPLTGSESRWSFHRTGGCTKGVACENLVLFRSSTAAYFDVAADSGTGNLSGFRAGCKNSLIPADGLLNAPNFANGCTCNYPVFTSLALVHMPRAEQWTTNDYAYDGHRVERMGLNFGAPGDRRADSSTVWLDFPSVGGPSPDIPVRVAPGHPRWYYRHSSRIEPGPLPWVVASGVEGLESITLTVADTGDTESGSSEESFGKTYTVRLYFAELFGARPGDRVFDISLQERTVLKNFDIRQVAGRASAGVVREFSGIRIATELAIQLQPKRGKPLISGVELIAED